MIGRVQVTSSVVTKMASTIRCWSCKHMLDVEMLFTARAIVESPELLEFLSESDRMGIDSLEQAQELASRLNVTNPGVPTVTCESCGGENRLIVSYYCHTMEVPSFLWCRCGQEVDLRYPGDRERVRFMLQFPYLPFVNCRGCRKRMLLPPLGRDTWRLPLFRLLNVFRKTN